MNDADILNEARKRFEYAQTYETYFRSNFLADKKFYFADEFNNFQWDDFIVNSRVQLNKPVLTTNRTQVLCDSIINDGRQNQPAIRIKATGNSASYKAAEIYEGVVRHIEQQSQAQECYDTAMFNQVVSGLGYWRIVTRYVDENSFDTDIFIERIADPLSVFQDPDIKTQSGEDQKWCFIFKNMDKDEFDREYPRYKDLPSIAFESEYFDWVTEEHIRVAEYYRIETTKDELFSMDDGTIIKASEIQDKELLKQIRQQAAKSREIEVPVVKWYLLAGDKIIDESTFPGTKIPVVRLVGKEAIIEGNMDRIGHVRGMRSNQRIINTMMSAQVEFIGLQSKCPWILPASALGEYTDMWNNSNTENFAFLLYNDYDQAGQRVIPPPQKAEPPVFSQGYAEALTQSMQGMVESTGQEPATLGKPGNERSAKAIQERTRAGDRSTYHFVYRLSEAIRLTGRIILDIIPLVYDTERVLSVLAQDKTTTYNVKVDPNHPEAHQEIPEEEIYSPEDVSMLWNPKVGKYSVVADSGPDYVSKRAEAVNALVQILQENKEIAPWTMDQLFLMMDFPGAEILAQRAKNLIPPAALGTGPSPQEQHLQQLLAQQHDAIGKMVMENQDLKNKMLIDEQQKQIDLYNAETKRYEVMAKSDPQGTLPLTREMVSQLLGEAINPLVHQHQIEAALIQKLLGDVHPQGDQTAQGGAPPTNLPAEQAPIPAPGSDNDEAN